MVTALINLGVALAGLAKLKSDEALFREAIAKFEAALVIRPKMPETLDNLGIALAGLANLESDEALFREAIANHEAALALRPEMAQILENLGSPLLFLWHLTKDAELLDRAREVMDRHDTLNPKKPYNRACLAARLGDEEGCRERLLRAKGFGTLPKIEHLKSDPDLETMRDKPWFKELTGN